MKLKLNRTVAGAKFETEQKCQNWPYHKWNKYTCMRIHEKLLFARSRDTAQWILDTSLHLVSHMFLCLPACFFSTFKNHSLPCGYLQIIYCSESLIITCDYIRLVCAFVCYAFLAQTSLLIFRSNGWWTWMCVVSLICLEFWTKNLNERKRLGKIFQCVCLANLDRCVGARRKWKTWANIIICLTFCVWFFLMICLK